MKKDGSKAQKEKTAVKFITAVFVFEKLGDYLLSHIASQYHRRKRA